LTTSKAQIVFKKLHEEVLGGHFPIDIITKKILDAGYWWLIQYKKNHDFIIQHMIVYLDHKHKKGS
jgi:hypothetical protein